MIKILLISVLTLLSSFDVTAETESNKDVVQACDSFITFSADVQNAENTVKVSESVAIAMKQFYSKTTVDGYKVASNVICQQLSGVKYSGSTEEWQGFLNNTVAELMQKGGTDLQFMIVGSDDAIYQSAYDHKEYIIHGTFKKVDQIIYNLAVLDKKNNTLYTLSVSGGKVVNKEIKAEFKRLVKSFTL